jgi:IS5 family transposase
MHQRSFAEMEFEGKRKVTRRERFLGAIEAVTPWAELAEQIEPFYPKGGGRGRPPIGLQRMLRMTIAQQCFGLSDEGTEDALYDSQALRQFVGIDLAREDAPDATTLLKFRRLLEAHRLTERIFAAINAHLTERGLILKEGTVVDATIIAAPSSTKNQEGRRDPEMHLTLPPKNVSLAAWFNLGKEVGNEEDEGTIHAGVQAGGGAAGRRRAEHRGGGTHAGRGGADPV